MSLFVFQCGCVKILSVGLCACEHIQLSVSVWLWKTFKNTKNHCRWSFFYASDQIQDGSQAQITRTGMSFSQDKTPEASQTENRRLLSGKQTVNLSDYQSLSGRESDRQIKIVLAVFDLNTVPRRTERSTSSGMMQHSSLTTLWIWVTVFPRTLQCMHTIAVYCFILCSALCFWCSASSNKLYTHLENSCVNSFVPWHTISSCRQSQTSCAVQRFSSPAPTQF